MLSQTDRADIISAKGIFTSEDLATIFECNSGAIRRIWFEADHGHVEMDVTNVSRHRMASLEIKRVIENTDDQEPIVSTGKTLLNLEDCDCRWIIGKDADGDYRYCGEAKGRGLRKQLKSYCREHATRAVLPGISIDADDPIATRRIAQPFSENGLVDTENTCATWDAYSEAMRRERQFDGGHYGYGFKYGNGIQGYSPIDGKPGTPKV